MQTNANVSLTDTDESSGQPLHGGLAPDTQRSIPIPADPVGRTIQGRYEIKRLLGRGGMGCVYEAEHLDLGRRVAVKLVDCSLAGDPEVATRIKQEARSTGAIESEHIVQVFDAGDDNDLGVFLVMELLKGEDLSALLAREQRLPQAIAASLIAQAAKGLARAHSAGIAHRDLKPANVFVCTREDGGSLVKLVDFGIAKLLREANEQGLDKAGTLAGTPHYMSPEQVLGLDVDHRTDVYSLGAVLFEAIVGRSPYKEMPTFEQTFMQILTVPCPRISQFVPDVHPDLDQLCAEMMARAPEARPEEMTTVRERLLAILEELGVKQTRSVSVSDDIGFAATMAPAPSVAAMRAGAEVGRTTESPVTAEVTGNHVMELPIDPNDPTDPLPTTRRPGARGTVGAALALAAAFAVFGVMKMGPGGGERSFGVAAPSVVVTSVVAAPELPAVVSPVRTITYEALPVVTFESLPVAKAKRAAPTR